MHQVILMRADLARFQQSETVLNGLVSLVLRQSLEIFDHSALDQVHQSLQTETICQLQEVQAPGRGNCWHLVRIEIAEQFVERVLAYTGKHYLFVEFHCSFVIDLWSKIFKKTRRKKKDIKHTTFALLSRKSPENMAFITSQRAVRIAL